MMPKIVIPEQSVQPICYGGYKGHGVCQCNECCETAKYQVTLHSTMRSGKECFFTLVTCYEHLHCFLRASGT